MPHKIANAWLTLVLALALGTAAAQAQSNDCKTDALSAATVDFASKTLPPPDAQLQTQNAPMVRLGLRDTIYIHVYKLSDLLAELEACRSTTKQLVLYLGGLPIRDLTGTLPRPAADGFLEFHVMRTSAAKEAWDRIMSRPTSRSRVIPISVGYADQFPVRSSLAVEFVVVPLWEAFLAIGFWLLAVVIFLVLAARTSIIRDGSATASFSLSRTQGAWWFFAILGAFMFIVATTGDPNAALNGTALTLIGISAATAGASAVVNASQAGEKQAAEQHMQEQVAQQEQQVAAIAAQAQAVPAAQDQLAQANTLLARKRDLLLRLRTPFQAENFLKDILSDADGISIHRFQMVVWTLVLSFIFVKGVYNDMAMPDFDSNLLTLQGISAATFVGLKMAEPSVPKEART
jgi:hypothetical protein